jgi:hypothetical protein
MRKSSCAARLILAFFLLLTLRAAAFAQEIDVTRLQKIGDAIGFIRNESGITIDCRDNSQVKLTVLAPDLIRVRAAFTKAIPTKDHSWAIAKEDWAKVAWSVNETADAIVVSTAELEVVVRRSPLLIEFRDARSHKPINSDEQPMSYGSKRPLLMKMKMSGARSKLNANSIRLNTRFPSIPRPTDKLPRLSPRTA